MYLSSAWSWAGTTGAYEGIPYRRFKAEFSYLFCIFVFPSKYSFLFLLCNALGSVRIRLPVYHNLPVFRE